MRYNFYMSRNNSRTSLYSFFLLFFLLSFINIYLLASNHNLFLGIFLSVCFLLLIFAQVFFWPDPILHNLKLGDQIQIVAYYLTGKNHIVVKVENGLIDKNFLLLRNKPSHFFIQVDHHSIVIITDQNNAIFPLNRGTHYINHGKKILHVLHKDLNLIQLGPLPKDKFPSDSKTHSESLADFHARSRRFNQTKMVTNDGRTLYPSFQIVYRLKQEEDPSILDRDLLGLVGELSRNRFPVEAKPEIDQIISNAVLENWLRITALMDSDTIQKMIESTPMKLDDFLDFSSSDVDLMNYFRISIFLGQIITTG